jgi:plastocyanin
MPGTLRRCVLAAAVAGLLAAPACGGGGDDGPTPAKSGKTAPLGAGNVVIKGFAFTPKELTVQAGTTVTWTHKDSATHTVTADDDSYKSGDLTNGATFGHLFDTAGTYKYHCSIHVSMTGTVTVH